MKKTSRILALVMVLAMVFSLGAFASGEPSGEPSAEPAAAAESTKDMTVSSYGTLNNFRRDDSGYVYLGIDVVDGAVTAEGNWDVADIAAIELNNEVEGAAFTAVRADGEGSDVTVSGSLKLWDPADDAQGVHASDFSAVGAAISGSNNASIVIEDLDIETDGFVRAGLIIDNYVNAWVKNSSMVTYGANPLTEAWDGYYNSANTGMMLSPPWVLGIQGGIRTINVLDAEPYLQIVDSYLASGGWGVISTDGCSNPVIDIVDSTVEILAESEGGMNSGWAILGYDEDAYGSGYGAYIIGNTDENYYGSTVEGTTFGIIAREGTVAFQSSNGAIETANYAGEDMGTVQGKGNVSVINSVFGAQTHSSETTAVSFLDGTEVNVEEAAILYRSSNISTFTFDNAVINSKAGILVQMMDDDDSIVGGFSPFNEFLYEVAGNPITNGELTGASEYNAEVTVNITNGDYKGDLLNGTGYYGQAGDVMIVNLGEGAALTGDIAMTATIHGVPYSAEALSAIKAVGDDIQYVFVDADFNVVDEANAAFIQFTQFSMRQYYLLCQVLNSVGYNGFSGINVHVTDGAVWTVEEESLISHLCIDGGTVYGEVIENADGTLTVIPSATALTAGDWGTEAVANIAAATGMGMASGEASGDASGEASEEPAAEEAADPQAAYAEYIHEWLLAELAVNSSMTIEQVEDEFMPLVEAGDYVSFPAEMLYNGMLNNGVALTFEEWSAQQ